MLLEVDSRRYVEARDALARFAELTKSYQQDAVEVFHAGGTARGGSGVIVLPCGAGKTIVGMACMAAVRSSTLIPTTNITASRQWIAEIMDKTALHTDHVSECLRNT